MSAWSSPDPTSCAPGGWDSCGASQEQDDTFEQGEALLAIDLVVKELVGPDEALEERIDAREAAHEDEVLREQQHAAGGDDGKDELSEGRAC